MKNHQHAGQVYLRDIPLQEAWERFRTALERYALWQPLPGEEIPLEEALGRVTAAPVWALISSPHYHAAAMDGYAIQAASTAGASDRNPVLLGLGTQAADVDTGDPLPAWADAVIPIEHVQLVGKAIRVRAGVPPWSDVRPMGEDMVASELVIPEGQILRPVDLGAIAGAGHTHVLVRRRPRVAIIPTGDEIIPRGATPEPGRIIEYNSLVLGAQVARWGGEALRRPIQPDDPQTLRQAVLAAAEQCDLVLVNAGSSAGADDHTANVVSSLGELLVHGVAVRPGHPVILGLIRAPSKEKAPTPVIGVPGYPVSAALTGEIFVEPLLARWLGRTPLERPTIQAHLTRKVHSSLGDDEYLRVTVGEVSGRTIAAPLARGAGVLTSLVRADGIVVIPAGTQGLQAGAEVEVRLYRSPAEIKRTIIALGSHDLTLDLMAQDLAPRGRRLVSGNVGSLGGLIALRRGEAHLAGCHLLDPESGEYNLRYIREQLPNTALRVLALVEREQGLIVAPGNPLSITGIADLQRKEVSFVNRQHGAGTRLLLDYQLEKLGIDPDRVRGYDREMYTHLTVAAGVASGSADCGLGIRAAAAALSLDFVPLFEERYDLVIPEAFYGHEKLAPLLDLLHQDSFRTAVERLPGYKADRMGEQIARFT